MVFADIRQQVEAGAQHITFGDPDFLNGPGYAIRLLIPAGSRLMELSEVRDLVGTYDPSALA